MKWGFRTCCLEGLDVDWDFAPSALRVGRDSELHSCCLVGLVVNSGLRVCSLKGLVSLRLVRAFCLEVLVVVWGFRSCCLEVCLSVGASGLLSGGLSCDQVCAPPVAGLVLNWSFT